MKREFLKMLGGGAAVLAMAGKLKAATPPGPGRLDRKVTPYEFGAKAGYTGTGAKFCCAATRGVPVFWYASWTWPTPSASRS